MGSHHDHNDHNSNEKKPVSFTVPLIFASVVVLIILLFVSLGDPKHGECCCKDKCNKECMDACKAGHCEKEKECSGKEKACCDKDAKDAHACEGEHSEAGVASDSTAATSAVDSTSANTEHKEEAHH